MPYAPSPAIPPGMSPQSWQRVINAAATEASRLAARLAAGGTVPKDVVTRALAMRATIGDLAAIASDMNLVADYTFMNYLAPQLTASHNQITGALTGHAQATGDDMGAWLTAHGWDTVPNTNALQAAAQRTGQAMLHDWERLTTATRLGVRDAVTRGIVSGTNPRTTAQLVHRAMLNTGGTTYARALNIARTEMADLYDASTMHTINGAEGVIGYRYEAQPDACPVCQVLHGLVYPPDQYPDRHHQCRCAIIPVLDDENAAPGDYYPGEQRPRHLVESQLPKSWQPLPDDLRTLLGKRANNGWRPSWTMRNPNQPPPGLPPRNTPPPGSDLPTNQWTPREQQAFNAWMGDENDGIAGYLRGDLAALPDTHRATYDQLNQAMQHAATTQPMTFHRGMTFQGEQPLDLRPGNVLQDPSFLSVSTEAKVGRKYAYDDQHLDEFLEYADDDEWGITLEIHAPKGTRAIDVEAATKNNQVWDWGDSEWLLDRDARLRIDSVQHLDPEGRAVHVTATIIGTP